MVNSAGGSKNTDSSKAEVGEIDTRAPFQSVKDAVNLFGEVAFFGGKPAIKKANPNSAERVLVKESELHLAQKKLNKLKEQLKNAENTESEALVKLEKDKETVENLTQTIKFLSDSNEASLQATIIAENRTMQLEKAKKGKLDLDNGFYIENSENTRAEYITVFSELNSAKQELAKLRQDFDRSIEEKTSFIRQAREAQIAAKVNTEQVSAISIEISALKETIEQVRQVSNETQNEQAKIIADKGVERHSYKCRLEEASKKLQLMKKEFDPEVAKNVEAQLSEAMSEIGALNTEKENAKESDLATVKRVTLVLDGAEDSLKKILEEGNALKSQVESLKQELEILRKEHAELKGKDGETESIAGNLHVKLRKCKSELEEYLTEEAKASAATDEMVVTLNQLASESKNARHDAAELKIKAADLKREAKATRAFVEEAEQKLKIARQESEEANIAESIAVEQIQALSEKTDAARSSTSESGPDITISKDELEALTRKVNEFEKLTGMKVEAAMAQVKAVKASEEEALQKMEDTLKEIEDIKAATEDTLKKTEMAEAAKKAVEGELRRLREREQKKAAEGLPIYLSRQQFRQLRT